MIKTVFITLLVLAFLVSIPSTLAAECRDMNDVGNKKCSWDWRTLVTCLDSNNDGTPEWSSEIIETCSGSPGSDDPDDEDYSGIGCVRVHHVPNGESYLEYLDYCPEIVDGKRVLRDGCVVGSTICSGPDLKWKITCVDWDGDGHYDYNVPDFYEHIFMDYCEFGCKIDNYAPASGSRAECLTSPTQCPNQCTPGESQCSADDRYVQTCSTSVITGCADWNHQWEICDYGCDSGSCMTFEDAFPGSTLPIVGDNETYSYYTFDNPINGHYNFTDDSGNNRNLTCSPPGACTAGYGPTSRFGPYGYDASGDGFPHRRFVSNDYPEVGSIDFWFKYMDDDCDFAIPFTLYAYDHTDYEVLQFYLNCHNVYVFSRGNPTVYYRVDDQFTDTNWHYIIFNWDREDTWLFVDNQLVIDDLGPPERSFWNGSDITYIFGTTSGSSIDYYFIDEFRISTINRYPQKPCADQCTFEGEATCDSGLGLYSLRCYLDNDGCYKYDDGNNYYCDYGCNELTGRCYDTDPSSDQCINGTYNCVEGGLYSTVCYDEDNDGFTEWSVYSKTPCGKYGCNVNTGLCNMPFNECDLGESICCGNGVDSDVFGVEYGIRFDSICFCSDDDGDGFTEWSSYNVTKCPFACQWDNYENNGTAYAWCLSTPDEAILHRNIVSSTSATINTAIQGSFLRVIASIVIMLISSFIIFKVSESPSFAGLGGITALGVTLGYGWLPVEFFVASMAICVILIFKFFIGDSDD